METNWTRRYAPLAVALVALLGSIWQTGRWISSGIRLQTDIAQLVPSSGMDSVTRRMYEELVDGMSDRLLVVVEDAQAAKVEAAGITLQEGLVSMEGVERVDARPDPAKLQMITVALLPYRDALLSADDREALLSDHEITVKKWMAEDPFFRLLPISKDPLGTLERFLTRALRVPGNIDSDGFFYWLNRKAGDNYAIAVFTDLDPGGVGTAPGDRLSTQLEALFDTIRSEYGVQVHASSAVFHASASKRQAQWETTFFGIVSTALVTVLITYAFMNVVPVAVMITVIGIALLSGFSIASWLFGEIHVLTLVMALPIIGVTVDYVIHSQVNLGLRTDAYHGLPPYLLRALCWGCFSSVLGFAALGGADIEVLRQVAVVLVTGLVTALLWVIALARVWPENRGNPRIEWLTNTRWIVRASEGLEVSRLSLRLTCFAVIFVLLGAWGFGTVKIVDDPNALRYVESDQIRNDQYVQRWLQLSESARSLVVHGSDVEQVLRRQEQLIDALNEQLGISSLGLSSVVPSLMRQESNRQLFSQAYALLGDKHGAPIDASGTTDKSLMPGDLPAGVLKILPPFDLAPERGDPWAATTLNEAVDWQVVSNWCSARAGCRAVDSIAALTKALGDTHRVARWALYMAIILVCLVLLTRYRERGVWATAALIVVVLCGQIVPGLLGMPLTLFATGGMFVLLGLSVDYLFFIAEASPRRQLTWLAFVLTAGTTLLAFGILVFSRTPAVRMLVAPVVAGLPAMLLMLFLIQSRLAAPPHNQGSVRI